MKNVPQPTEKADYCTDCGTAPCFHPFSPALVAALEAAEERADALALAVERWRFVALFGALVTVLLLMALIGVVA